MRLDQLIAGEAAAKLNGDPATEISDLAYDSRAVADGALFFCVRGMRSDGHDHAEAAVAAGASALVVERSLDLGVPEVLVDDARAAMGPLASHFFGDPTAELALIGVTGTNGKTTTAFLVHSLIEAGGVGCGLMGTVKQIVAGVEEEVERTTPEAIDLQRTFRRMLDGGDRACVIEVSSHAVRLGRTAASHFRVAAFSNLTQDHLDFHPDMEDYYDAKRALFIPPGQGPGPASAVVNIDDPWGSRLADELADLEGPPTLRLSRRGAAVDLTASEVSFDHSGSRFRALGSGYDHAVEITLPGEFNVDNALLALGVAAALELDRDVSVAALADADAVPGRMEPIDAGQEFAVLVDYAHTPDSLDNVLTAARRLTAGRLISVVGCGGDRDRDKRPQMGRIATALSDLTVITSDNPRSEEPAAILDEIVAGVKEGAYEVEVDRRAAIAIAIAAAAEGDVVVIAGKGHEQGQEFADGRKIPFDDREVAREELERMVTR